MKNTTEEQRLEDEVANRIANLQREQGRIHPDEYDDRHNAIMDHYSLSVQAILSRKKTGYES